MKLEMVNFQVVLQLPKVFQANKTSNQVCTLKILAAEKKKILKKKALVMQDEEHLR